MFLPKSFDTAEYFGYGPYESYCDKHQASYLGRFAQRTDDFFEDYVKPQENGSRFGCKSVTVTDGAGAVTVTSPADFSFNLSRYTQEELAAKKHNYELKADVLRRGNVHVPVRPCRRVRKPRALGGALKY